MSAKALEGGPPVELTDRKKKILRSVVESYIQTAEPVGSKALAELAGLKVSSATIRNDLADLTEEGYLEQPHTSAGRIPSPKGYRLYVNELMEEQRLSLEETKQINEALHLKMRDAWCPSSPTTRPSPWRRGCGG